MKKVMQKAMVCVAALTLLLTAGFTQAAVWTGAGADNLWTTPGNWDPAVPGPADWATINDANGADSEPLIEAGMNIAVARVELSLEGGTQATLNMTGGSIVTGGNFVVGQSGTGVVHFNGGTVDAASLVVGGGSSVDITEGLLQLHGDRTEQMADYVDAGLITGYSGEGTVWYDYSFPEDLTLLWANLGFLGDVNQDGQVNGLDVDPFVDVLTAGSVSYQWEADMDQDGVVNGLDIDPFVAAVLGGAAVATAPEPATLVLLGIGTFGLLLLRQRRRQLPIMKTTCP